jgi:hypothetical protein
MFHSEVSYFVLKCRRRRSCQASGTILMVFVDTAIPVCYRIRTRHRLHLFDARPTSIVPGAAVPQERFRM